jgi:hypothetical protein
LMCARTVIAPVSPGVTLISYINKKVSWTLEIDTNPKRVKVKLK